VGGYAKCTVHVGASTTCVGVDASTVTESMDCYDGTGYRYTNSPSYQIVDLSDAANPKVVPSKVTFSLPDEAVSARAVGNSLFVTVKNLTAVAGDPRPYAKYYLKRVDLTNPSVPVIDNGINIPGYPIDVDDTKIFTRDTQWGGTWNESAIGYVQIKGNVAELQNYKRFHGRYLSSAIVDGHDTLIVAHNPEWDSGYGQARLLDIMKPQKKNVDYEMISQTPLDYWMYPFSSTERRLFFSVTGGTLVANIDDLTKPVAQAFFPVYSGNGNIVVHNNAMIVAGGRLGVFQLDKNASNLLTAD
jgi:hypothetical protein